MKGIAIGGYSTRVTARDEPFDIAFFGWAADYLDPFNFINVLLDGRFVGTTNWGRFDSPGYNASMRRAARLSGEARLRAYAQLDERLSRDAAPAVPVDLPSATTLVSRRIGCVVLRPELDLTAVCLKQ